MAAVLEAHPRPQVRRAAAGDRTEKRRGWPSARTGYGVALLAGLTGFLLPTAALWSPASGPGIALGIFGCSMLFLLVLASLRTGRPLPAWVGSERITFDVRKVLAVLGLLSVLYHCNFGLDALHGNAAFVCMLIVLMSDFVGRSMHLRMHDGIHVGPGTAADLARTAANLKQHSRALKRLPGLIEALEFGENRIGTPASIWLRPWLAAWRYHEQRHRMQRLVAIAVDVAAARSHVIAGERDRLAGAVTRYVEARLVAARRLAEFDACQRLLTAWRALHLLLCTLLVLAVMGHLVVALLR